MGALCCCFHASDEQDNHVVEDSGEFPHLKWFFPMFIKKRTVQSPPSNPSGAGRSHDIAGVATTRLRVQPKPACRQSGGENIGIDLKTRPGEEISQVITINMSEEVSHGTNDEDSCPTCFYEYTEEHPKIVMKCSHHYHLSCIYEWMERSEYCPVCQEMMLFDESS